MKRQKVGVIGAPVWQGQAHQGVKLGPDAMRLAGLMKLLRSINPDTVDCGNVAARTISPVLPVNYHNMKHLETIRYYSEIMAKQLSVIVENGRFPIVLGGDHSIAIGSIAGIASHYENLGVIWYDAHADINTPETSPSGNIHGMPLAACMGFGHESLTSIGGYSPKVKPENIVMIGVRDIDPGEAELIANRKIKVYSAQDVARLGAEKVISQTVEYLASKCDGIHLSFDLDALDPKVACGVGTPASGGIDLQSTLTMLTYLYRRKVITSADVVEVNPLLDKDGQTVKIALAAVHTLLTGNVPEEILFDVNMAG